MGMVLLGRRLTAEEVRRLRADPSLVVMLLDEDRTVPELDLDRSWHALHYLLTGTAWDVTEGAGEAVLGGEPIGEDVGYGPARLFLQPKVHAVADGLGPLSIDALRHRYDPAAFRAAGIYPDGWVENSLDTYLAAHFGALRSFFLTSAELDRAVLLAIM